MLPTGHRHLKPASRQLSQLKSWIDARLWEIRLIPLTEEEEFVHLDDQVDPVTVPDYLFGEEESGRYETN